MIAIDTHIDMITPDHPCWPSKLSGIPYPPRQLYYRGNRSLLNSTCVAVVGTRTPTERGCQYARLITTTLVREGYTIVAGLAAGIDIVAHQTAIELGGNTIAVLGTTLGWQDIYPKENVGLARLISESGSLLITEYCESKYAPQRFFERDRIQAGLSFAVIPVQTGLHNPNGRPAGTMHTVNAALAQGRHILAPRVKRSEYEQHPGKWDGNVTLIQECKAVPFDPYKPAELVRLLDELCQ